VLDDSSSKRTNLVDRKLKIYPYPLSLPEVDERFDRRVEGCDVPPRSR
jgi:hypothetical protein